MLVHTEQSECPGELRLLLQRRRWQDFHVLFFAPCYPLDGLKDLSGIGLGVCHHLPRESATVSWEGETGTRIAN